MNIERIGLVFKLVHCERLLQGGKDYNQHESTQATRHRNPPKLLLCCLDNLPIYSHMSIQMCAHLVQTGLRLARRDWPRNYLPWKWTTVRGHQRQIPFYYLGHSTYSFFSQHTKWIFSFQYEISTAPDIVTHSPSQCFMLQLLPLRLPENNSIIHCKSRTEVYSCPLLRGIYISYCSIESHLSRGFVNIKKGMNRSSA